MDLPSALIGATAAYVTVSLVLAVRRLVLDLREARREHDAARTLADHEQVNELARRNGT